MIYYKQYNLLPLLVTSYDLQSNSTKTLTYQENPPTSKIQPKYNLKSCKEEWIKVEARFNIKSILHNNVNDICSFCCFSTSAVLIMTLCYSLNPRYINCSRISISFLS